MDYWADLASSRLLRSLTRSDLADELLKLIGCESRVGHTIINDQKVVLCITLLPQFPSVLPLVAMFPPPTRPLPHVGETGFVCYVQHEGLLLDESRPSVIITDAVRRSLAIIEQGLVGANHDDYREEFAYYWERGQAELINVSSTFAPDSQICPLRAWFRRRQEAYPFEISSPEAKPPRGGHHAVEGLYVPLLADASLLPPETGSTWDVEQCCEVINAHSGYSVDEVLAHLQKPQRCRFIVWGIPLPKSSNFVLVGSWLVSEEWGSRRWQHPLFSSTPRNASPCEVVPLSLERYDVRYIVERGGGYPELLDKHVAVVGCGAVGSVVAEQLARAGVGALTLIDDDIFSRDNLHRHSLNLDDVQRPKVDALKDNFCKSYPYLEVDAWRKRIENLLDAKVLQKFDLLVLATGDQTTELKVSQFVHEELEGLGLLHTWLEPMGLGGHALLSHVTLENHGCFECLFRDRGDGLGFYNRASFAAPKQSFAHSISGCAVSFVPYGALHATRTACLAVGMALDFLRGRQAEHELRSWKGDARDFIAAGHITSARYDLSQDGLDERRCQFSHPSCQRCSG